MMDPTTLYFFDPVDLTLPDIAADGLILDVGAGGEGMIGRLKGTNVVAIDLRKDELLEAPDGPLKIVADARELSFGDNAFAAATAFFSFLYVDGKTDQQKIFDEIHRVLKPGGRLHVWDIDLSELPKTEKPLFAIRVKCHIRDTVCEAGYGRPWPTGLRNSQHYATLADLSGFRRNEVKRLANLFYACFEK